MSDELKKQLADALLIIIETRDGYDKKINRTDYIHYNGKAAGMEEALSMLADIEGATAHRYQERMMQSKISAEAKLIDARPEPVDKRTIFERIRNL